MTLRSGILASALSLLLVIATASLMVASATALPRVVRILMVVTVVSHGLLIFVGSARLIVSSSIFVLLAVTLESLASSDPSWVRSIAVGVLWYVAMEVSWHALERREGAIYTRAAVAHRVQEVALVVGLTLVVGLVAIAAATVAPGRSVALQAVVLGAVLAVLGAVARQLTRGDDNKASIT